jgi:hypothetical protein
MPPRRARPEQQIQKAVFAHLKWRGVPGAFAWHPFSGGYRRPVEAAIYTTLGAVSGLPDVLIVRGGQLFGLELKSKNGRVTAAQAECHRCLRASGARIAVATGIDQAVKQFEAWAPLRPSS